MTEKVKNRSGKSGNRIGAQSQCRFYFYWAAFRTPAIHNSGAGGYAPAASVIYFIL